MQALICAGMVSRAPLCRLTKHSKLSMLAMVGATSFCHARQFPWRVTKRGGPQGRRTTLALSFRKAENMVCTRARPARVVHQLRPPSFASTRSSTFPASHLKAHLEPARVPLWTAMGLLCAVRMDLVTVVSPMPRTSPRDVPDAPHVKGLPDIPYSGDVPDVSNGKKCARHIRYKRCTMCPKHESILGT